MENPIKKLYKYFQQEPGQALTFGYVLLISIGTLFSFTYYRIFKINVLQFAELDDLLLAPIQDMGVLLTVFAFCVFVYYLIELNIWWRATYPNSYRRFSFMKDPFSEVNTKKLQSASVLLFPIYILNAALFYGIWQAKIVKRGESKKIVLEMKSTISADSTKAKPLFFIGKTKAYYFVYDTALKKTTIINADEVRKVSFEK